MTVRADSRGIALSMGGPTGNRGTSLCLGAGRMPEGWPMAWGLWLAVVRRGGVGAGLVVKAGQVARGQAEEADSGGFQDGANRRGGRPDVVTRQ